ncbi:MAG TPA: UDP-N-acetylmuramate dehydrogenase [Spirochaetota bacterium]|mgnify:FL=1|nr:UDP-N-acetylmuramate dehydrogenase [Spirochaetota bacterium]
MKNSKKHIPDSIQKELLSLGSLREGVSMSSVTTFKTGGAADYLLEPFDEAAVVSAVSLLKSESIEFHIIGGGSNLLVSDTGLRGVVIRLADENAGTQVIDGLIYAASSVSKEKFIAEAIEKGFGGVEFMAGIPGAIGGGIFMNAGTYMGCFSDILRKIRISDYQGNIREVQVTCESSGYRHMEIPENSIILGGLFSLPENDDPGGVRSRVDDIIADRWNKHPMEFPSAGSVFKNPEGHSSWKLINDSGLKGFSVGGAMVSEKHTNFIINNGNASSSDIFRLVKHIQETVYRRFSVNLETEIRFLGEF